jgi:hypothetical protein
VRRREFICLLGGAVAAWPLAAGAQQPERMRRIGVLMGFGESDAEGTLWLSSFTGALQEAGWVDGRNVRMDVRWSTSNTERERIFAKELVSLQPDVILAHGTPVTAALRRETQTIPIVFGAVADPVGEGFVESLPRPGGNITGFLFSEAGMGGKWLELLKSIARIPLRISRPKMEIRVLQGPKSTGGPLQSDGHPPTQRYGRVFVGPVEAARGMSFEAVFVPGLAEKLFPHKIVEEPILLDAVRAQLNSGLTTNVERVARERLALGLAAAAAERRLYLSYPRLDLEQARPRVPSFYALETVRAAEGRLPNFAELDRRAEAVTSIRVGWPAPRDPAEAIDHAEHDLAILDRVLALDPAEAAGAARYLLTANPYLGRALRTRWQRWRPRWTSAVAVGRIPRGDCEARTRCAQLLANRAPGLCCLSVPVFSAGYPQACATRLVSIASGAPGVQCDSTLMLADLMIGHHFSISAFWKAASAAGVCCSRGAITQAEVVRRLRTTVSPRASTTATLSLVILMRRRASMSQNIVGWIAFTGDLDPDPDAAAIALRAAGFAVTRMPAKFRSRLAHPLDDFMLVSIGGTMTDDDEKIMIAVMDEINAIVDGYGGLCHECDVLPLDDVPSFETWFGQCVRAS